MKCNPYTQNNLNLNLKADFNVQSTDECRRNRRHDGFVAGTHTDGPVPTPSSNYAYKNLLLLDDYWHALPDLNFRHTCNRSQHCGLINKINHYY